MKKDYVFPSDRDMEEDTFLTELKDILERNNSLKDGTKVVKIKTGEIVKFYVKSGAVNSLVKIFDEYGCLRQIIQYVNDVKHGMYMKYHDNGKTACCGTMYNGKAIGVWSFFDKFGKEEKVKYS